MNPDDRGSALVLVPIAVLVLLMAVGLTMDTSRAVVEQRRLATATATVADDVAATGLDRAAFHLDGTVRLAPQHVLAELAAERLTAQGIDSPAEVVRIDDRTVAVTLRTTVDPWLAPGGPWSVHATTTGILEIRPTA